MSANPIQIAQGPGLVKAADSIRQMQERRDNWPYPWVYPPPGSERRNPFGFTVMPAVAASAVVLTFNIPTGFVFEMDAIMFAAVTTAFAPIGNPGDYTFSVNRNTPVTGVAPQGSPLTDFQNVPFPMGNPATSAMWPLRRSEKFAPLDVVRVYVNNVSGVGGAPNFAVAMIGGWQRKA